MCLSVRVSSLDARDHPAVPHTPLGRSPSLAFGCSRNPLVVVHTTVAPKARSVEAVAEGLQTSKDRGTDTDAVQSAPALERVAWSQLIRILLQPTVCWAFQGTIDSREID
jgi:hypothetical protein